MYKYFLFAGAYCNHVVLFQDEVEEIVSSSLKAIKVSERGVYVQASTLGSLEALLEFLKSSKIPVSSAVSIIVFAETAVQ